MPDDDSPETDGEREVREANERADIADAREREARADSERDRIERDRNERNQPEPREADPEPPEGGTDDP